MRMIRTALAALALLCAGAISFPAFAADNVDVTAGSGKTMACKDITSVCYSKVLPYDSGGTDMTNTTYHALTTTDVACTELAATSSVGTFSPCQLQKAMVGALLSSAAQPVFGDVQHGATGTDFPVPIGGNCKTADPTFEATGDRVNQLYTCGGKIVTQPYALRANLVSGLTAAMTGTTSTAVTGIGAPGASLFNYITSLTCGNSHATVGTFVELQDGSGGTTFYTVPAAPAYGGASPTFPAPLKQPTANTALFVKDTTTGANVICSASGYTAP